MKKRKFDAVLFDVDGTVLNTGELLIRNLKIAG